MTDCGVDGDPEYSDTLTAIYTAGVQRMADRFVNGEISLDDLHTQMKGAIDGMTTKQALAGVNGDVSRIDSYDKERIRSTIIDQYQYLDGFMEKIQTAIDNDGSLDFVANRAGMYAKSSKAEYWRQTTSGADLPAQPGDGSSECHSNCGCSWDCQDDGWHWIRSKDDSCPTCIEREQKWNPYQPSGS